MRMEVFYCGHCGGLANPKSEKCEFCGAYFVEKKKATMEEVDDIQVSWADKLSGIITESGTNLDTQQLLKDLDDAKKQVDKYGNDFPPITLPKEILDKEIKKKEKIKYVKDLRGKEIGEKFVSVDPGKEGTAVVTEEKDGIIHTDMLVVPAGSLVDAFNTSDEDLKPGDPVTFGDNGWPSVKPWKPTEGTIPVGVAHHSVDGKDYGSTIISMNVFSPEEKEKFRLEIIRDKLKCVLGKYASHATMRNYTEMRHEVMRLMEEYDYVPHHLDISTSVNNGKVHFYIGEVRGKNSIQLDLPLKEKVQCPYPGGRLGEGTKKLPIVPSRAIEEVKKDNWMVLVSAVTIMWIIFAIIMWIIFAILAQVLFG